MPQDAPTQNIPVEASDVLVFTPDSLKSIAGAPSFTLRAATLRDERYFNMLLDEEGLATFNEKQIRAEAKRGLEAMWSPEDHAEHFPRIEAYWDSLDTFVALRRADPEAEWDCPESEIVRVNEILREVEEFHRPLARMKAKIRDYQAYSPVYLVAVIVTGWTGLDVPRRTERGYVVADCAARIARKLFEYEQTHAAAHGLTPGKAFQELCDACERRLTLDEEEAKNFASPSPSSENPEPSTETNTSAKAGKSQASARSSKIPATE